MSAKVQTGEVRRLAIVLDKTAQYDLHWLQRRHLTDKGATIRHALAVCAEVEARMDQEEQ